MKLRTQIAILLSVILVFGLFNLVCYELFTKRYIFNRSEGMIAKSIEIDKYLPWGEDTETVTIDASIKLEGDLPVIDGAAALYPVFSGIVGSTYPESSVIYDGSDFTSESKLRMNNTMGAYEEIVTGEADIIFCAAPSDEQLEFARNNNVELVLTPIGREAFVFFVNENNPVSDLSVDDVRAIYAGRINNWSEVGGANYPITHLSRNPGSGSQSTMDRFMDGEPIAFDYDAAFGRCIAFSFRYYVNDLTNYGGIKILSLNGIYPSIDTISDGSYPLASYFYAVTRADNSNPNVDILLDWILSEEGQAVIEANGYVGVN